MPRELEGVGTITTAEHVRGLAVQMRATSCGRARFQRLADDLVREPHHALPLDQQSGAHRGVEVVEQPADLLIDDGSQQVDVDGGAEHCGREQARGTVAEGIDPGLRQLANGGGQRVALGGRELDEEQRIAATALVQCGGPIVGLFEGASYEEETVHMTAGDWLVVFSDGVSEALSASGEEYGEARIIECVRRNAALDPSRLLEALFHDVREFTQGEPQGDDITAMVIRYGAP